MPENFDDLTKIRHVQPGDPVAAEVTSQPTRAIELRLRNLQAEEDANNSSALTAIVIPNVPIYTSSTDVPNSVGVNDVVYFNPSSGLYEKALAQVTVINGVFTANPTALGFGVVVAVNGGSANVMVGGFAPWSDSLGTQQTAMLEAGQNFVPGPYYISATQPGKITQYPPALRIQILVATAQHFVIAPAFSTPESIESMYRVPIGMRPVGSLRAIPPSYTSNVVVGFDALELYDTVNNYWRLTKDGGVANHQSFGYLVADATVTTQPASPIFIRVEIAATSGAITVYSANSLAELSDSSGTKFNTVTSLPALSGNPATVRNYAVVDQSGNAYGTLSFKFTDLDVTFARVMPFQFPDSFQGWKMVSAPVTPSATATLLNGVITNIVLVEKSIGYQTPPSIVISDTGIGTGATATAVLDDFGSIASVIVNSGGTGYSNPTISFVDVVSSVNVTNGGSGATATATATSGVITGTTVSAGGTNYGSAPNVVVYDSAGTGSGAIIHSTVQNGVVTKLTIVDGGQGYGSPVLVILPSNRGYLPGAYPFFTGGSPASVATATATLTSAGIDHVEVFCPGGDYDPGTTLSLSGVRNGGSGAILQPVIVGGQIVKVNVLNPGSGYTSAPTPTISGAVNGNNVFLNLVIGGSVNAATLTAAGSGYQSAPAVAMASWLRSVDLENPGSGYTSAPTVTLSPPDDPAGVQAVAGAILGGGLIDVQIVNGGSGYTSPNSVTITSVGGGTLFGATITPIIVGGVLVDIRILYPGQSYTSTPTLVVSGGGGTGAVLVATVSSNTSLIGFVIGNIGSGYINPPTVTIAPPTSGTAATALARLVGFGAQLSPVMSGFGGLRSTQVAPLTKGNNLQITTFHQDLDDGTVAFPAPQSCVFYYNIKADPNLQARYPAVPVDKASFFLNGTEQLTTPYNEGTQLMSDLDADIGLARKSIFWPTFALDGSPWDATYQMLINDPGTGGRDPIIQGTGPTGASDYWWRMWERLFKYENYRNRAWLSINRASQFYQSGKVASLAALSPLRLVNAATGVDSSNDGTPQDGQLLIVIDNQVNILGGTGLQIDLTATNNLVAIYQNNTGQQVMISSIILTVAYQQNSIGIIPTVTNCAQITVGTQTGNYNNIIGSSTADVASTRLYAQNQVKELFPDADNAYVLLQPNEQVYLQVNNPAGGPILKQVATAKIKGHIF